VLFVVEKHLDSSNIRIISNTIWTDFELWIFRNKGVTSTSKDILSLSKDNKVRQISLFCDLAMEGAKPLIT